MTGRSTPWFCADGPWAYPAPSRSSIFAAPTWKLVTVQHQSVLRIQCKLIRKFFKYSNVGSNMRSWASSSQTESCWLQNYALLITLATGNIDGSCYNRPDSNLSPWANLLGSRLCGHAQKQEKCSCDLEWLEDMLQQLTLMSYPPDLMMHNALSLSSKNSSHSKHWENCQGYNVTTTASRLMAYGLQWKYTYNIV